MATESRYEVNVGVMIVRSNNGVLVPIVIVIVPSPGTMHLKFYHIRNYNSGNVKEKVSYLKLVKRGNPVCNNGPHFFSKPVVINLEVRYARFLLEFWAAAAEVVASVALTTEVHSAGVDDQRAV